MLRRPQPALLGPYCPLFARKFSNTSAPHTLQALLGLLAREQVLNPELMYRVWEVGRAAHGV